MDTFLFLLDFILHLDQHIGELLRDYGVWVYGILFLIIFVETGLVVMPFLPGDSLLFIVGAYSATGALDLYVLCPVLIVAAILGDFCNYWVGHWFGPKVFTWKESRFFNRRAFDKAHQFYEDHGALTIIAARFMPFLRTFSPFVAGVVKMDYWRFQFYNITGAIIWVVSLCLAGFWFGHIPWVKSNLSAIVLLLIVIPALPALLLLRAPKNSPLAPPVSASKET